MKEISTTLNIGVEKPFSFIHLSDTHIILADRRNDQRKIELAEKRAAYPVFKEAKAVLEKAAQISKQRNITIVHTGDLIDFVSYANLDAAKEFVQKTDCLFTAGNHEFSLYLGEAVEDEEYRNKSLDLVQKHFNNDIRFYSKIINGVNFVGIDDSYYRIDKEQLKKLKAETEKDYPIILYMHSPLYAEELYNYHRELHPEIPFTYLLNVPENKMDFYPPAIFKEQKADETTEEAYDLIVNCDKIKAVLAGHIHFDYECKVTPDLPQIVTGCSTIRTVTVV